MITKPYKINFKASEQELAMIKANAAKAGYCLSEYIRLAALGLPVQPQETK
jgi:predicted DNA binding CopG/RHH family protein